MGVTTILAVSVCNLSTLAYYLAWERYIHTWFGSLVVRDKVAIAIKPHGKVLLEISINDFLYAQLCQWSINFRYSNWCLLWFMEWFICNNCGSSSMLPLSAQTLLRVKQRDVLHISHPVLKFTCFSRANTSPKNIKATCR